MRGLYSTRRAQTQGHATSRHWNAFSRFSDCNSGNCALVELLVFFEIIFFPEGSGCARGIPRPFIRPVSGTG